VTGYLGALKKDKKIFSFKKLQNLNFFLFRLIFWCSLRTVLLALNFKAAGHYEKKIMSVLSGDSTLDFFYMIMDNSMSSCVCRVKEEKF
jgi:hypothetical protein